MAGQGHGAEKTCIDPLQIFGQSAVENARNQTVGCHLVFGRLSADEMKLYQNLSGNEMKDLVQYTISQSSLLASVNSSAGAIPLAAKERMRERARIMNKAPGMPSVETSPSIKHRWSWSAMKKS